MTASSPFSTSVLLAAGGTGGHIIPAIATAKRILKDNPSSNIIISGVGTELEKKLLSSNNTGPDNAAQQLFEYKAFNTSGMLGRGLLSKLSSAFSYLKNLYSCLAFLKEKKVKVIFGFGGYPSFLPVFSGWILRIPVYIFEQNGKAGVANKVLAKLAKGILVVPDCDDFSGKEIIRVLNPVREEILNIPDSGEPENTSNQEMKILILGGSQGAASLNSSIISNCEILKDKVSIWHQTGEKDFERIQKAYTEQQMQNTIVTKFITNMPEALIWANIVISRAGASTVAELMAAKKPGIFLPLPIAGGHQSYNIKNLVSSGGCVMIKQDAEAHTNLRNVLTALLQDANYLSNLKNNLNKFLAELNYKRGDEVISSIVKSYA